MTQQFCGAEHTSLLDSEGYFTSKWNDHDYSKFPVETRLPSTDNTTDQCLHQETYSTISHFGVCNKADPISGLDYAVPGLTCTKLIDNDTSSHTKPVMCSLSAHPELEPPSTNLIDIGSSKYSKPVTSSIRSHLETELPSNNLIDKHNSSHFQPVTSNVTSIPDIGPLSNKINHNHDTSPSKPVISRFSSSGTLKISLNFSFNTSHKTYII